MGYELKKTPKNCKMYIDCFVNMIIKEVNRGNEIQIDGFGIFKPKFIGGVDKCVCGEIKYIDPRIGVDFNLTGRGLNKVNKEVVNNKEKDKFKKRIMVDGFKVYLDTKLTTQTAIDNGEFYLTVDCDEMPSPRLIKVTYNKVSQSAEKIYKLIEEA